MVVACACFAAVSAGAKKAAVDLSPLQIGFFRYLFGLLPLLPWILGQGRLTLRTSRLPLHALRAGANLGAMYLWFTAVSLVPIADVMALGFTTPLLTAVGAAIFLREIVTPRLWGGLAVGFAGTLIIIRPGLGAPLDGALIMLGSAAFMAVAALFTKSLTRTEKTETVVLYMTLIGLATSIVPAVLVWRPPSADNLLWMAVAGIAASVGHLCLTKALASADASVVMPFNFSTLLFATVYGYFLFDEQPDSWTWIGAAIIFAAGILVVRGRGRAPRAGPEA